MAVGQEETPLENSTGLRVMYRRSCADAVQKPSLLGTLHRKLCELKWTQLKTLDNESRCWITFASRRFENRYTEFECKNELMS